jgi:hypothetical protein
LCKTEGGSASSCFLCACQGWFHSRWASLDVRGYWE